MTAIILERENHPDRCIDRSIGPFPDWETAKVFAADLEKSPGNVNGHGNRRYRYEVIDLTPPEEA